ncbi:50S ribosome-binding GTPase [Erwinia persicina]|uniref:GTPase family protein n=1 Tax=Erwinia persicina TaxID=55211 RepID=UPI001654B4C3|nr:GTPase [Erwinia persicina]MBC3946729.1 50S ribosome-binding GTPase [Erwinia persicina]
MSDNNEQGFNTLKQHLSILPEHLSHTILNRIRECIHYEPVIGIMGKCGVGKSSLCNALFRQQLSPISHVAGCTREPLRFTLDVGGKKMVLVDLPGVGESLDHDHEYLELYRTLLPELDLILWVIKADDRASASDEDFHRLLLDSGVSPGSIVFIINQADKAEPSREWCRETDTPSDKQLLTLTARSAAISKQFFTPFPVYAVSANTGYNLSRLVETLVYALPREASSGVFCQLKPQFRTHEVESAVRKDFGELVGELLSRVVEVIPLPKALRDGLEYVRNSLVNSAAMLWHWFF